MERTGSVLPQKYAIFQTGGKQYQAIEGRTLGIEKLNAEAGASVEFKEVLLVKNGESYAVGDPFVSGAAIKAEILKQTVGPKIVVFKFKRRKKYRVKNGHRQPVTVVRFTSING